GCSLNSQALGIQVCTNLLGKCVTLLKDLIPEDRLKLGIRRIQCTAQAQAHAATLRVDPDDAQDQLLALLNNLLRMLDPLISKLGNVDQALDAILDAGKRTEVGELGDSALDQLANLVGLAHAAPRLWLGALDRQRDLLLFGVDAEDIHLDLFANL